MTAAARDTGTDLLEARLFGDFEVRVDGAVVPWTGQRGVSVLRYLLARPRHACSRDELLEEFWPDTASPVARNRLQVAVSGLRHALRDITDRPVIEYCNGGYRINPGMQTSIDTERFEAALGAGRSSEHSGRTAVALSAYREGVEFYRGDFAADAPFEAWTVLPRESLRLAYLDALDRTSRILLGSGRLDDCVATAHRMLDADPCREDAHRLLMRCFVKQGRPYLAIRQYELCRTMLGATLDTVPDPETVRLYETVRAGAGPRIAR